MTARALAAGLLALAACSSKGAAKQAPAGSGSGSARAAIGSSATTAPGELPTLPPAPPLPSPPAALPVPRVAIGGSAELVALGEALFFEARLSDGDQTSCATCHDPARDYAGTGPQPTATGKPNLRQAPSLTTVAWQEGLGWDGRYPALKNLLLQHWRGQLGLDPSVAVPKLASIPLYRALFTRGVGREPDGGGALEALGAFVTSRYIGDAPWDKVERGEVPDDPRLRAGYALFTGKAQCGTCHTPPLYSDLGYHRLFQDISTDDGRGKVDVGAPGAFKTPSLRGAAARAAFFHDGSVRTLEAAIDWHLAGGVDLAGDRSKIDPALTPITLTAAERDDLIAFVRALTPPARSTPRPLVVP